MEDSSGQKLSPFKYRARVSFPFGLNVFVKKKMEGKRRMRIQPGGEKIWIYTEIKPQLKLVKLL